MLFLSCLMRCSFTIFVNNLFTETLNGRLNNSMFAQSKIHSYIVCILLVTIFMLYIFSFIFCTKFIHVCDILYVIFLLSEVISKSVNSQEHNFKTLIIKSLKAVIFFFIKTKSNL